MKHLQLFEDFTNQYDDTVNESLLDDIVKKSKTGVATGALAAALLTSPDVSAQDKAAIAKANTEVQTPQEANSVGVGTSPDYTFAKEIALSRAITDLAKNLPNGSTLSYEIVDEKTIQLQNGMYQTTVILKISPNGTKVTSNQLAVKKKAVVRDDAKIKREAHMSDVNAEILARAKRFGFETVDEYMAWQAERNKGEDQPLDGLQGPNFKSTDCGISKAGAKDAKREWKKK